MGKIKLSVVIIPRNEEKNIRECLKTLKWCNEIVVIDDYSEDRTAEIAKKSGAKVFKRHLDGDFAAQRNFSLKKAKNKWILFVDADERVTPKLAAEIKGAVKDEKFVGFNLRRQDFIWGRQLKYGETANVRLLRLGQKGAGEWQRRVHEIWEIKGRVGELKEPLLHYPHPTINKFLEEMNFYTGLNASEFLKEGRRVGLIQILVYPIGKFFQNYIFRLGFLDGTPGIITALMMSFHSFLTRAKLYLLWKRGDWWEL